MNQIIKNQNIVTKTSGNQILGQSVIFPTKVSAELCNIYISMWARFTCLQYLILIIELKMKFEID